MHSYTTLLSDLAPDLNNGEEDDENKVDNDDDGAGENETVERSPAPENGPEGELPASCDRCTLGHRECEGDSTDQA